MEIQRHFIFFQTLVQHLPDHVVQDASVAVISQVHLRVESDNHVDGLATGGLQLNKIQ